MGLGEYRSSAGSTQTFNSRRQSARAISGDCASDRSCLVTGIRRFEAARALTTDVVGGYAFNSFHLDPSTIADYQRRAASDVHGEATNMFVVKPELTLWYDLNRRIGIKVNGGYLVARPSVTIVSTLGRDARSIRADTFSLPSALSTRSSDAAAKERGRQ